MAHHWAHLRLQAAVMCSDALLLLQCRAYLVVDDAPGVRHHLVVVVGKGMATGSGRSKGVTQQLHITSASLQQRLLDVKCCQCS